MHVRFKPLFISRKTVGSLLLWKQRVIAICKKKLIKCLDIVTHMTHECHRIEAQPHQTLLEQRWDILENAYRNINWLYAICNIISLDESDWSSNKTGREKQLSKLERGKI